jgi:hypothetical protein
MPTVSKSVRTFEKQRVALKIEDGQGMHAIASVGICVSLKFEGMSKS